MQDEFVSTEHLLVALTKTDSKARQILELNGTAGKSRIVSRMQMRTVHNQF